MARTCYLVQAVLGLLFLSGASGHHYFDQVGIWIGLAQARQFIQRFGFGVRSMSGWIKRPAIIMLGRATFTALFVKPAYLPVSFASRQV